jgi:hypothetical protein
MIAHVKRVNQRPKSWLRVAPDETAMSKPKACVVMDSAALLKPPAAP